MTTNKAALALRGQLPKPFDPAASDHLAELLDEALAAAKAEGAREAVERIRAQVISDLVDEKGDIWSTQDVHDWIMPIVEGQP